MKHELKTDHLVFDAVFAGLKTHEIRLNDRCFAVGDELLLKETKFTGAEMKAGAPLEFTGREVTKVISHVLTGYGLQDGWCILSFEQNQQLAAQNAELKKCFEERKAVCRTAFDCNDAQSETIKQLEAQNAELVAMVENLRIAALNAVQQMSGGEAKAALRDAYDATPAHHLRDRDAEVLSKKLEGLLHVVANQYDGDDTTEWSIGANHVFKLFAKEITKRQEVQK